MKEAIRGLCGCLNPGKTRSLGKRAALPPVRVYHLKHTSGRRSMAVGVSFEDRRDLLGYRSGRTTTNYFAAKIGNLIATTSRM